MKILLYDRAYCWQRREQMHADTKFSVDVFLLFISPSCTISLLGSSSCCNTIFSSLYRIGQIKENINILQTVMRSHSISDLLELFVMTSKLSIGLQLINSPQQPYYMAFEPLETHIIMRQRQKFPKDFPEFWNAFLERKHHFLNRIQHSVFQQNRKLGKES